MTGLRLISSPTRQLVAGLALIAVAVAVEVAVLSSSASSPPLRYLESMFQDDNHLVYASTQTVTSTLDRLKQLGVDTIRVTMLWKAIAPRSGSRTPPAGFHAADPAAYPAAAWAPYDRLVALARARAITVNFDLTAPGPLWAMSGGAPTKSYADHWLPSARRFGEFVAAVGRRYSGTYTAPGQPSPLPRVRYWSIWNEPNQPGWLAPQWRRTGGRVSMLAPALYRGYVNAAYRALARTGHRPGEDILLIGELAPEGCEPGGPCVYTRLNWSIPPIPFLRTLYCLDGADKPLTGAAAAQLGCPSSGDRGMFVAANPGLFKATGFAHHPYSFFLRPDASMPDPNFVPLSDLTRLERALDGGFRAYGVARQLDLYLTEYGYETNPPDPFRGVTPEAQSAYLDEAQYMAWRDPRVRAFSQFLLYDAPPDRRYKPGTQRYWSTFQTGLLFQNGVAKPSLRSYRLPLFVPDPRSSAGQMLVWAMLRPAPHRSVQLARVQWQPFTGGTVSTVATVGAQNPTGVLSVRVNVPGPGMLRIAWRSPAGQVYYSGWVGVRPG